jgi:hypothetical protein
MPAVLSKVTPDGDAPEVVIELDENGQPVYTPIPVFCKHKGKNILMWEVEQHKLAVDFLKNHVPVCMYGSN